MIEKRIKERFGTKANFCAKHGHKPKDLAEKLRTVASKLGWLNKFLAPLGLKAEVVEDVKPWPKCPNCAGDNVEAIEFECGDCGKYWSPPEVPRPTLREDLIGEELPSLKLPLNSSGSGLRSPKTPEVDGIKDKTHVGVGFLEDLETSEAEHEAMVLKAGEANAATHPCCGAPADENHEEHCSSLI